MPTTCTHIASVEQCHCNSQQGKMDAATVTLVDCLLDALPIVVLLFLFLSNAVMMLMLQASLFC